jgi:hypothetical protein
LVVSGGVLAAFVGPETGQATRGVFGDTENLLYMGVFVMTGIFNLANMVCIIAVQFPTTTGKQDATETVASTPPVYDARLFAFAAIYKSLFRTRSFLFPMLIATLSWAIMAVPMSLLRVAMKDAGYTDRQSLTAIELHFCGMYATGFVTGQLIQLCGVRVVCGTGLVVSSTALALNLTSETKEEGTVATWLLGMIFLGIGWNFVFTGATVWLTKTVDDVFYTKNQVQSANDCAMFLIAGAWIFGASYIYDAGFWGKGVLSGWRTLNFLVVGLVAVDFLVMSTDWYLERRRRVETELAFRHATATLYSSELVVEEDGILKDYPRNSILVQDHSRTTTDSVEVLFREAVCGQPLHLCIE